MKIILIAIASFFSVIGLVGFVFMIYRLFRGESPLKVEKLPTEMDLRARDEAAMKAFKRFTASNKKKDAA